MPVEAGYKVSSFIRLQKQAAVDFAKQLRDIIARRQVSQHYFRLFTLVSKSTNAAAYDAGQVA